MQQSLLETYYPLNLAPFTCPFLIIFIASIPLKVFPFTIE